MKRSKPLRRFGRRAARQADEWATARLLVLTAALVSVAGLKNRPNRYECARCRKAFEQVDCHHLVSRARGGGHDLSNLAVLCRPCHSEIHTGCPDDVKQWIRSGRDARFRNDAPLEESPAHPKEEEA